MVEQAKLKQMRRLYDPQQYYRKTEHAHLMALSTLAGECGLTRVLPREGVAPLRAVVPGSNEAVSVPDALWSEHVEGVSVDALAIAMPRKMLLRTLASVPHEAVRDAALLDLLTMQGDRHGEQVFLARGGRGFKLIDSRDAILDPNGMDSLFLPTTPTFARSRVGNGFFTNGWAKVRVIAAHLKPYPRSAHAARRRAPPSCR